ncbi:MAG: hypothetical protein D4R91_03200 [Sediminibacterium sp.]|nr:MAG: hypothetical protein D4R91_03200 [Sediminibacterium sp.]
MNIKVGSHLSKLKTWKVETEALRAILHEFPLTEELKWGKPCYAFENSNIIIIQGFKEYCGLLFFKGALLKDAKGLLVKPGENTQGGRLLKYTSVQEINKLTTTIQSYIKEAIEIEKQGLKIEPANSELVLPDELLAQFKKSVSFKKAFNALTPGRQRAYNMFFSAAKQAATRETRIEKYKDQIMSGKGINDCTCGLSQKMPYCDGSHRQLK